MNDDQLFLHISIRFDILQCNVTTTVLRNRAVFERHNNEKGQPGDEQNKVLYGTPCSVKIQCFYVLRDDGPTKVETCHVIAYRSLHSKLIPRDL